MIREAMQFLTGLKEEAMEPKVVEIAGKTYCNKNLQRYDEEPTAKEITASTLTAMIDYIYNLSDELRENMIIHVQDPQTVRLYSGLNKERKREYLFRSDSIVPCFRYGNYYGQEEFLIEMQANFEVTPDLETILKVAGNVEAKTTANYGDDGVTQKTTIKQGIASKADVLVPNALEIAGADEVDGDNGLELSIYGLTYEYIYVKENEACLSVKNVSAENTFMVKDDSIEENELFAVYYYVKKDDANTKPDRYMATVLTPNYKYELDIQNDKTIFQETTEKPIPHYMGDIPIIEYLNNKLAIGDFELQIPLIDAYNALMSDRVTDKEQFIDAILAIYGTLLADDEVEDENGEKKDGMEAAIKQLKKRKVLEVPDGAKAEYLTRTFDESGVEILKKAIE